MFIGIDLGTSSVKTILIDENQNTLATKTELISIQNLKLVIMNKILKSGMKPL